MLALLVVMVHKGLSIHSCNSGCNLVEKSFTEEGSTWCASFGEDKTKTVTLLPLMMAWYGMVAIGDDTTATSVALAALVELDDDVVDSTMSDTNSICCCPAKIVTLLETFTSTELPHATSGG